MDLGGSVRDGGLPATCLLLARLLTGRARTTTTPASEMPVDPTPSQPASQPASHPTTSRDESSSPGRLLARPASRPPSLPAHYHPIFRTPLSPPPRPPHNPFQFPTSLDVVSSLSVSPPAHPLSPASFARSFAPHKISFLLSPP